MKQLTIAILCLLASISFSAYGQKKSRIGEYQRSFITSKLALSAEDSVKFWPVFDEYNKKRIDIHREIKAIQEGAVAKNDEQLKDDIDKYLTLEQSITDLKKDYIRKMQGIISTRQVVALLQVEQQFKRKLLERIGGNRNKGGRGGKGNRQY